MGQVLPPLPLLTHRPRPSIYRCSPLTSRHTLSSHEFAFSLAKHNNAIERAAVRKLAAQLLVPSRSSLPKLQSTTVTPVITTPLSLASSNLSQDSLTLPTPSTPPTPLEVEQGPLPEIKPKSNIFRNTTKSDELLDLTLAALHCIYIDDFSQGSDSSQSELVMQPGMSVASTEIGAYRDCYDQSPGLTDGSSVSSGRSTPTVYTPPSMSPEADAEIACPTREGTPKYHTASAVKAKMQSVGRTQSLPGNYQYKALTAAPRPILQDKSLRWFLTELLRRSRASASVVQLALHYLKQAREPVGEILNQKFKSVRVGGDDMGSDIDSPLVDPRKLVLAAIMLSTKILHDHAPNSRAWSRVCGLEARQVSACESALGQALNWELVHMIVGPRDDSVLFE
ncbi:unnamed protein product [Rhizoctonia solani]|uniref:Cyclin N-terminal domain-containing protein n=1 Tax=Rhizoctonia solani TaxID=456999 RepID=A0A8H3AQV1_9AGAM|nr:unnamed protein product [Rhizoctonia solani]CAE6451799.1 unnamed protein product [Rhizoctonia solani]